MATYLELERIGEDDGLGRLIKEALYIAAEALLSGTPTDDEIVWADYVLLRPGDEITKAQHALIAQNENATIAQITGASDATVQTAVNGFVPSLVVAHKLAPPPP